MPTVTLKITSASTDEEIRAAARAQYGSEGEIEIDDSAVVSRMDDPTADQGAYVQAWVYILFETDEEEDDDDE